MLNPQKVFSLQLVNTDLLNISISSWFSQLLMHDIYIKEKHIHASHTMHIVNILATILGGWKLDIWSGTKLTTQSEYNIASYIWLFFFISIAVIEHRYINLRTSHDSEPLIWLLYRSDFSSMVVNKLFFSLLKPPKVSGKEAFILFLFFLLLLYSVITFLKSWNKNYRDINHLPFYTMCEDKTSIAPGLTILPFKDPKKKNNVLNSIEKK